ncbi:hypothetical protein SSX86_025586 [Deinandra increscens subsp. villosa]|uniref:Uncharacterized protein n=1 Tax=Deinandra increscens subsp. villosa TaxID=3103831 RepID=A0AAP0GLI8_9ASTR
MAFNRRWSEEGSIKGRSSDQNTNSTDDQLPVIRELTRGTGEMTIIRALQRFAGPIFEPIFRPLIHQLVKNELAAKQEALISLKENSSVLKNLKLQFRNKIAQPVFTGMTLLGENQEPIKIALVDALSGQIVNSGAESAANLEIMCLRVGDDDVTYTSYKDVQERILSERNGRQNLQGNTCLQLKEGVGFLHKISFTHNSKHTRNGSYRLVAVVVDAALINEVEVAWSETFAMKDRRCTYHEKNPCPALSDKVCHLQQISYKGARYKRLKNAGVFSVKDLLRLLYTDRKQLEDILQLKAPSKFWDDIVKNAQASSGMFLYLDPRNEQKTGVVLDVKLQLKALIVEPGLCVAVNQLSEQQKVQTRDVMKYASEHFDMLHPFDHETSLQEYLQSCPGFTSLPSAMMKDEPPTPSSQVTKASHSLDNPNHKPFVTTRSERGKEKVPFDGEMIPSLSDYEEHNLFHPPSLESPNGRNSGTATEPGTSFQAAGSCLDTCELMNISDINDPMLNESQLFSFLNDNDIRDILNGSPNECQLNPAIVSFCTIAQTRWTKVSKLLRRNSVRERICLSQGIQPLKKQRCC